MISAETPLLERLAAAEFGARQVLKLRQHLSVSPEDRKELKGLLDNFERDLAPNLPQEEAVVRHGAFLWATGREEEAEGLVNHRRHIPLACFLVGAQPNCYFCYTWGWNPEEG